MSKIAILATNGFEQSELFSPLEYLKKAGHTVHVLSLKLAGSNEKPTEIKAWDQNDWGKSVAVDHQLDDCSPEDYDALVLPGGQMNPDTLRAEPKVINFIKAFAKTGKPLAAICHAPWLLIEAGLANGKKMTSYKSIRTDLKNAGATTIEESVVKDGNLITSRNPDDLPAFNQAIEEALQKTLSTSNS